MAPADSAEAAARFLVSGRVQGVFFRESTRRTAARLGLAGYAINLPDGRVEVVAIGEEDAIKQLERWLWDGPRLADVTDVTKAPYEGVELRGFTTG